MRDHIHAFVGSEKGLLDNIQVIKVEPRLFKTFFTIIFMEDGSKEGYESIITPTRDDIHIMLDDVDRVSERLELLRGSEEEKRPRVIAHYRQLASRIT